MSGVPALVSALAVESGAKLVHVTIPHKESAIARQAGVSDAGDLARLRWIWRAVERNETGDPDRFGVDFGDWMAKHHETHLPFMVEVDGAAVGMAWLAVIERIPGPENWTRLSGAIQSVYVLAEHRNCGLGSILLRELIQGARHKGLDYLSVHPSPRSFPFYRRLDFRGEGSLLFLELSSAGPTMIA
jgi:GNAT superfamily N-acetyltransferase